MSYIENIYICMIAPMLIATLILKKEGRRYLVFIVAGITACLLSAYVSSFIAGAAAVDALTASYEITPAVEEIMKFIPVMFYLLIFSPGKQHAIGGAVLVAVGFATFENACFFTSYGTAELLRMVIRGFGTGAIHVVCAMAVSVGLFFLWDQIWLRTIGAFALLCFAITLHAIFNILVNQSGAVFWVGTSLPLTLVLAYLALLRGRLELS